MLTDPIGDMLTRIRNAGRARHRDVRCASSKLRLAVARVLQQEGFLGEVRVEPHEGKALLVMEVRYGREGHALIDGIRRVSRPGRRVYVGAKEIPNRVDSWGPQFAHQWPTWRQMLPQYLRELIP